MISDSKECEVSLHIFNVSYFPAHKTHRPIRRKKVFLVNILVKIIMNVF